MLTYFLKLFKIPSLNNENGVVHRAYTTKYEDLCQ